MVLISEWLPNPSGDDATGEWIELHNTALAPVALDGWRLENGRGAKYSLDGHTIGAEGYLLLSRATTKLALRNSTEEISLYRATERMDISSMPGAAQEGKSLARNGDAFLFADPTPGTKNAFQEVEARNATLPQTAAISGNFGAASFFGLSILFGACVAAALIFVIQKNNDLQKLFFGGNEEIR